MSFILDALKKSEHERQRQSMPGLVQATPIRPKPRLPLWAIALCALLAVNLLVLMVVLMRGWLAPVATEQPAPRDPPQRATPSRAADADTPFSPLDASPAPVYAPEVPVTARPPPAPAPAPAPAPESNTHASPSIGGSGERTLRRRDPLLTEDNYKPNEDEVLPSVNELNLTGAQELPELHLDVHVFATRASDRFVFINMRKYHEGATLQEGPTIERIRRDGVILAYQGLRFLLPRQ